MIWSHYIIAVLVILILILEVIKVIHRDIPVERGGIDTGISMTIGDREVQQDAATTITTESGTMAVLADGAGKMYGGRIASRIAVNTFDEIFRDYNAFNNPQYYFRRAFHSANKEITKALIDENRGNASVGCAIIRSNYLYYAVAGDVKIAVFRGNTLIPVSVGQTIAVYAEKKFHEGKISRQDALELLQNQRLYNYLGKDDFKDIEYFDEPIHLKKDDIVVLMSNSIQDLIGYGEIEETMKKSMSCQDKALEIIEKVNQSICESKDNASIVLVAMRNGDAQ